MKHLNPKAPINPQSDLGCAVESAAQVALDHHIAVNRSRKVLPMRFLLSVVLLALLASTLFAQDKPNYELFGGYSYILADTDARIDLNRFGAAGSAKVDKAHLHGWNASVAANPTGWLGIVADFSGHYGDAEATATNGASVQRVGIPLRVHNFLFGPRLSYRGDNVTAFGHVLLGVSRLDVPLNAAVAGVPGSIGETAFALAVGGGVDVKLTDRVWLRPIQADALLTRYHVNLTERGWQIVPRLSSGIVVRDK
jgi:opacity protein-like surface antigen